MNWTEIILAGVMGYTWSQILTRDGMIFGWWPVLLQRGFGKSATKSDCGCMIEYKQPPPGWIRKPLYECPACVTGLWYLVYLIATGISWATILHLFAAIFIADVLAKKL